MLLHYYTLSHIANELDAMRGMFLTECFTQERNTLHCVFESGRETRTLEAHLDSRNGAIFLRSEFHRARKNTLGLFPELIGRTLQRASIMPNERILRLVLPPYTLHFIVFSGGVEIAGDVSAPANALLTLPVENSPVERIMAAFRMPQHLVGMSLSLKSSSSQALRDIAPTTPLQKALSTCNTLLGNLYAQEAVRRITAETGLQGAEELGAETVQTHFTAIERIANEVRTECLTATTFFFLRDKRNKPLFSLLRPTNKVEFPQAEHSYVVEQEYSSASEAIRHTIMARHREARFHALMATAEAKLQAVVAKAERTVVAIGQDTEGAERSKDRQLWAELLLSQPNVQQKGLESITVKNWDDEEVVIRLNPAATLHQNAEEYFQKAATARITVKKREQRWQQQHQIIRRTKEALARLRTITTERELEKFMATIGQTTKITSASADSPQHQKTTRFREFPLDDEHTLYVGKTAADNDELTLRFAKPHDYWFHARGVPGSHAILRSPNKDKKPPKHILEQAASIAAYFSKARNAKMSPVAYTQKKYVRKPKGAALGAVILEREEVVMVRPHVPSQLLGSESEE